MTQKNIDMKRVYEKPSLEIYQLVINQHLLQGSETLPTLPTTDEESDQQW
jgi:hypothetical protein